MATDQEFFESKTEEDKSRQEINKLLELAEKIQEEIEKRTNLVAINSFMVLVSFFVALALMVKFDFSQEAVLMAIAIAGLSASLIFLQQKSIINKRAIDQRALGEVLRLVREAGSVLATKDDWSTLEKAEFRIRLSRFEI